MDVHAALLLNGAVIVALPVSLVNTRFAMLCSVALLVIDMTLRKVAFVALLVSRMAVQAVLLLCSSVCSSLCSCHFGRQNSQAVLRRGFRPLCCCGVRTTALHSGAGQVKRCSETRC
ncbi:unnamed protein product [Prorocentrum cordatum]|uniref:Uncharacterized protein n=1 Tax=Prorocentrum cordatum TaxID=2364126 RepID=A0ABN9QEF3_9DINO|nr:unnamed protein product [Polarella glacialis]